MTGYGWLPLLMGQENGTFQGETRKLMPERFAHMPGLGHHNLISVKARAKTHDVPMRIEQASAVIRPRQGERSLF